MSKRVSKFLLAFVVGTFLIIGYMITKNINDNDSERKEIVDVTKSPYAADSNGLINSSDDIQQAINDVSENGGGTVFLPSGTYQLKSKIFLKSNVTLRGSGESTVIKGDFSKTGSPLITNKVTVPLENVTLSNFRLDRTGINTQHGILLGNATNFLAEKIEVFSNEDRPGGAIGISAFDVYAKYPSKNIRVKNSTFYYTGNFGVQFGNVKSGVVENNDFYDGYREVIGVEPYGESGVAQDIRIKGNFIFNKAVTVNGTPTGKVIITNSSGGSAKKISIEENVIQEDIASGNGLPGIAVYGASEVEISKNAVSNIGGSGILITSAYGKVAEKILINNNKVLNCSLRNNVAGISLIDTHNSVISKNFVSGNKHIYGISEGKTSNNNTIKKNMLYGNKLPVQESEYKLGSNYEDNYDQYMK
ncbi:right-handed parallel beta-helix repeat-containing protein [Priestia megaterium]|uniref:right-handed parallel beta-helix repeat-containing protein n=1 Tax=Priestia megaterium TaxID=1404 RepID=UPI0023DC123B|nr:right-handed parallel beta-helix repeat-containing protein [Priestia megaterium]MDF2056291.1 glycosyl hydrolase family 28-related protein [Priestia megaterium]MDF2060253.1 glycosyl hydrolase family 28-related protein [Priestia megaterium]